MIKLNNLSFSYNKAAPYVINNISLTVNKGDYISIIGDNGSGKSTLIKLILKLLEPTKGSIKNNLVKTGYLPQKLENLNSQFPITVFEMLNCYRNTLKIKDKNIISKYLELVKMNDFRNSLIGTLSGGQCRKIFIARALMGTPDLLIFDEPSAGVDAKSQNEIYSLIKNINRNNGITVISVEHNLKAAISNSTLIYHLINGNGHLCTPKEYIKEYMTTCTGDDCYAAV
jgi:zinc transport system ATP-binding protein